MTKLILLLLPALLMSASMTCAQVESLTPDRIDGNFSTTPITVQGNGTASLTGGPQWLRSPDNSTVAVLFFNTTSSSCQIQLQQEAPILPSPLRRSLVWGSPCLFAPPASPVTCIVRFTTNGSLELELQVERQGNRPSSLFWRSDTDGQGASSMTIFNASSGPCFERNRVELAPAPAPVA
ncbi:hypothetical protein SELMODRAFT_419045 [Selaginella moellendorffii]|uniref:Pherophorin domain-containing protein n=1 Tax=Selaginella moellendorffii TaxID=88036 RepID=D8S7N1_SELML|nr:hypothetical protein SELMODRAFT_419045 [Selaginella moellendorffii]